MNKTSKVIKYVLFDVVRSRWLVIYTLFFFVVTYSLFNLGGNEERVLISLMNIVLFIIPLVSVLFGTMYQYHSREFIELLLSQPISRRMLFTGLYLGLTIPLSLGYALGVALPFAVYSQTYLPALLALMLLSGILLTFIFVALALWVANLFEEKIKGFGFAILFWLLFAVIYDGLILFIAFAFEDYPLEKPLMAMSFFNPIDLARILMLLKSDFSALMGYTGALFREFFGTSSGLAFSIVFLIGWSLVPYVLGLRVFLKKNF